MNAIIVWREYLTNKGPCGLCQNTGIIKTMGQKTVANIRAGVNAFCICPNGRAMRKSTDKKKWDGAKGSSIIAEDK